MKKHIAIIVILFIVTAVLVFTLFPNQTTQPEEKAFEPTPLVIETEDEEKVSNPTPGTVTIVTPYQESQCWSGLMYINPDGEMTRVTLFDAVESDFDEHY